jgi:hypothetical protein
MLKGGGFKGSRFMLMGLGFKVHANGFRVEGSC